MEKFLKINRNRKWLMPITTLLFLFALNFNVNAQALSTNKITKPAICSSSTPFKPGILIGTEVKVTDAYGSTCPNVTYEWQSASDASFKENLKRNLASTKDFNPGTVTKTTYFHRVVSIKCANPDASTSSTTPGIKITIQ